MTPAAPSQRGPGQHGHPELLGRELDNDRDIAGLGNDPWN